jgi:hypothetical protein
VAVIDCSEDPDETLKLNTAAAAAAAVYLAACLAAAGHQVAVQGAGVVAGFQSAVCAVALTLEMLLLQGEPQVCARAPSGSD